MTELTPDDVEYDWLPDCEQSVMVLAFNGWNDAGEAATSSVDELRNRLGAEKFAHIDGEGFYDYQQARPVVSIENGVLQEVQWPRTTFWFAELPGGAGVVLGSANEPHFRWKAYVARLESIARQLGVQRVVILGALMADVPHTRPCTIITTASSIDLRLQLGFKGADYEGPTGIVGVVNQLLAEAGFEAASIWASVPHYVSVSPNPKGTLALLETLPSVLGTPLDLDDLRSECEAFETSVNEAMADNAEVKAYVHMLERRVDESAADAAGSGEPLVQGSIPTGDELAAELQRFLEGQGDSSDSD